VRWHDFAEGNSWYQQRKADIFAISPETSVPEIVLNEGIPNVRSILSSTGVSGVKARIRDVTCFSIAHQVWSSLLSAAVLKLAEGAKDVGSVHDALEDLQAWEQAVLRQWAPVLYPETDTESAMDSLLDDVVDGVRLRDILISRLPHAIQKKIGSAKGFDGLVSEVLNREN
jgi:hypothetical protein